MLYRKREQFGYVTYNPTREQSVSSWTTGPSMLSDKNVFGSVFLSCFPLLPATPTLAIIPFQLMCPWGFNVSQYSTRACQFGLPPCHFTSLKAFLFSPQQAISTFLANKKIFLTSVSFSGINIPKFGISISNYALAMTWSTFNLPVHVELAYLTGIYSERETFQYGIKCHWRG